jgi:DNA-binding transcriptional regulator YiaG
MKIKKWSEVKKRRFSEEQLLKLNERVADELFEMDLRTLREVLKITQEELARITEMTQSEVSRLERRPDHKISTLRRLIEALGGELELIANFGDKRVRLHVV